MNNSIVIISDLIIFYTVVLVVLVVMVVIVVVIAAVILIKYLTLFKQFHNQYLHNSSTIADCIHCRDYCQLKYKMKMLKL